MATTVEQIPGIMRAKGWIKGAELMERWFSLPAAAYPDYGPASTGIITWDWALGFSDPRTRLAAAIEDAIWVNDAAREVLEAKFKRNGLLSAGTRRFDWTVGTAAAIDPNYTQLLAISGGVVPNAMVAALANFTFRFCVAGRVERADQGGALGAIDRARGGRYKVTIETVAYYLRDSYDFHDERPWLRSQPLGHWNAETNDATALPRWGSTPVFNRDFRAWREANGRGGDFLIYTPVRRLTGRSDVFYFHA